MELLKSLTLWLYGAQSHYVYFGTNKTAIATADSASPELVCGGSIIRIVKIVGVPWLRIFIHHNNNIIIMYMTEYYHRTSWYKKSESIVTLYSDVHSYCMHDRSIRVTIITVTCIALANIHDIVAFSR